MVSGVWLVSEIQDGVLKLHHDGNFQSSNKPRRRKKDFYSHRSIRPSLYFHISHKKGFCPIFTTHKSKITFVTMTRLITLATVLSACALNASAFSPVSISLRAVSINLQDSCVASSFVLRV